MHTQCSTTAGCSMDHEQAYDEELFHLAKLQCLGEKAMLILMAILKLLIHKIPEDPQPEDHFRIGI